MTPFYDKHADGLKNGYSHRVIEAPDMRIEFYVCPFCAAMVTDWQQHRHFHRSLTEDGAK